MNDEITALNTENTNLKQELANANYRIEELELAVKNAIATTEEVIRILS